MPKSVIFTAPLASTMMLAGFTSRWTTPLSMREGQAFRDLRRDVRDALRRQHDARVHDVAQRLARRGTPSRCRRRRRSCPTSWMVTTLGWLRRPGGLRLAEEAPLEGLASRRWTGPSVDGLDRDHAGRSADRAPCRRHPSRRARSRRRSRNGRACGAGRGGRRSWGRVWVLQVPLCQSVDGCRIERHRSAPLRRAILARRRQRPGPRILDHASARASLFPLGH